MDPNLLFSNSIAFEIMAFIGARIRHFGQKLLKIDLWTKFPTYKIQAGNEFLVSNDAISDALSFRFLHLKSNESFGYKT